MSANAVEKQAQKLNQLLRMQGKKLGKAWRVNVRALLAQTFEALNAKPLNGALCLELSQKIDAELAALENGETTLSEPNAIEMPSPASPKADETPVVDSSAEKPCIGEANSGEKEDARIGEAESADEGEARIGEANSAAGDTSPEQHKEIPPEEIGLFDLIRVQIRCFFTLNACVRPPYIGKFVRRSDKFAESTQARIDKFISVLSNNEDDFAAKTDIEIGYNDDLLPDMPERGLVLHPKKKKKK